MALVIGILMLLAFPWKANFSTSEDVKNALRKTLAGNHLRVVSMRGNFANRPTSWDWQQNLLRTVELGSMVQPGDRIHPSDNLGDLVLEDDGNTFSILCFEDATDRDGCYVLVYSNGKVRGNARLKIQKRSLDWLTGASGK